MAWIPITAWIAAVVVAVAVLGFCAYDLLGKAKRLRGDLARLQELDGRVARLRADLTAAQQRLAATDLRAAPERDARLEPSGRHSANTD